MRRRRSSAGEELSDEAMVIPSEDGRKKLLFKLLQAIIGASFVNFCLIYFVEIIRRRFYNLLSLRY